MTDRPNSRYRADTDVNQINQTNLNLLVRKSILWPTGLKYDCSRLARNAGFADDMI